MSLLSHLSEIAGQVFADLGFDPELGETVPSQRPELAQFQINGAMAVTIDGKEMTLQQASVFLMSTDRKKREEV